MARPVKKSAPSKGRSMKDYDPDEIYTESDKHAGLHFEGLDENEDEMNSDEEYDQNIENVMNINDEDSEDDDDDSDEGSDLDDDSDMMSSDDEEIQRKAKQREEQMSKAWGKKKSTFYNHDNEVEIDDEAAAEEEKEVLRLQKKKAKEMKEEDIMFGISSKAKSKKSIPSVEEDSFGAVLASRKGKNVSLASKSNALSTLDEVETVERDLSKLSKNEKLDLIRSDAPELLSLIEEMDSKTDELRNVIAPILQAVRAGKIKTDKGIDFLEMKHQLLLSYLTNITFVLLLKAEGRSIRDHPVITQLVQIRSMMDKLRPLEEKLQPQLARYIRAADRKSSKTDSQFDGVDENGLYAGSDDDNVDYSDVKQHPRAQAKSLKKKNSMISNMDDDYDEDYDARPNPSALQSHSSSKPAKSKSASKYDDEEEDDNSEEEKGKGVYKPVLRTSVEMETKDSRGRKADKLLEKKLRNSKILQTMKSIHADTPEEAGVFGDIHDGYNEASSSSAKLAELERERKRFEEDNFVRLQESKEEKRLKKGRARAQERWSSLKELEQFGELDALSRDLDAHDEGLQPSIRTSRRRSDSSDSENLASSFDSIAHRSGGAVAATAAGGMESRLGGKRSRVAAGVLELASLDKASREKDRKFSKTGRYDSDDDDDDFREVDNRGKHDRDEEDPFYAAVAQMAQKRKARREEMHHQQEEETRRIVKSQKDKEVEFDEDGELHRSVGRDIMKNRGLTKYRKKEERNPRVHNRIKAAKREKNRRGQVAPMRNTDGSEGAAYAGEASGIRTNISKSRKIR